MLVHYLEELSDESKSRFGPHAFNYDTIESLVQNEGFCLLIAIDSHSDTIIAYIIVKNGWIDYESPRLSSYGLIESRRDATIAPSVADLWQSRGLGSKFYSFVLNYLKNEKHVERLFLWGGVQNSNTKAINFYNKHGFNKLGEFEYHGWNTDMVFEIKNMYHIP